MTSKKIGELLQEAQVITKDQLAEALKAQQETGELIGETFLRLKMVNSNTLSTMLALQREVEGVNLDEVRPAPEALELLSPYQAMELGCLPLKLDGPTLVVAMADPTDAGKVANIAMLTRRSVEPRVTPQTSLYKYIREYYRVKRPDEIQWKDQMLKHLLSIKQHIEDLEQLLTEEYKDDFQD